jgi:AraC family transcriptional regulator
VIVRATTLFNVVKETIHARMSDNVNVTMLYSALGLSRSHFSRAFHKATGEAPRAYISRLRVQHAISLMREGDISFSDIALAAGFADQAHFSNAFRRATGATPSQWRRSRP